MKKGLIQNGKTVVKNQQTEVPGGGWFTDYGDCKLFITLRNCQERELLLMYQCVEVNATLPGVERCQTSSLNVKVRP